MNIESVRKNSGYLLMSSGCVIFCLLLNYCNKISDCSLIFTCLAFLLNNISERYGKNKAIVSVIIAAVISFTFTYGMEYRIHGELINGLVIGSLLSLLVSSYAGLSILSKLKDKYDYYVRNFISLVVYALIDGLVMALFFFNIYSTDRVFTIFYKEVGYKCMYSFIGLSIFSVVFHCYKAMKNDFKVK